MAAIFGRKSIFIKSVIWAVVAAFVLSIFVIAGNFVSTMNKRDPEAERQKQLEERKLKKDEQLKALAMVNEKPITVGDYETQLMSQPKDVRGKLKAENREADLLEQLITLNLIKEGAQQLKISVSREEMLAEVKRMFLEYRKMELQDKDAENMLDGKVPGLANLKDQIEVQLLLKKVQDTLLKTKPVSAEEIQKYYEAHISEFTREETVDGKTQTVQMSLPEATPLIEKKLRKTVTEQDKKVYYEEHKHLFQKPEQYRILDILINPHDEARIKRISSKLTDTEVNNFWKMNKNDYMNEKQVEAWHILVTEDEDADINVSDEDIKKQYEDNPEKYMTEEQAKASHVLIIPDSDKWISQAKVTDSEMKEYYNNNTQEFEKEKEVKASHILVATESKAQEIKGMLKKGQSFEELAKKYSDDKSNADKGGDLGYFDDKTMVEPFTKAAFSMKKGEISDPVKTRFGYHIIKVTDIKEAKKLSYYEAKREIERKLKEEKARDLARSEAEEVLKKAKSGADFDALARDYSEAKSASRGGNLGYFYKGKIPENFPLDSIKGEITMGGSIDFRFENAVFATEAGKVYDGIVESNFGFHVIKVFDRKPAERKPLAEVREQIASDLAATQKEQAASILAENIIKKLNNNEEEFKVLAAQYSKAPSAKVGGYIGYIPKGQIPEGFDTAKCEEILDGNSVKYDIEKALFALSIDGVTRRPVKTDDGYHIFKVTDIKAKTPKAYDEVKAQVRESLAKRLAEKEAKELSEKVLAESYTGSDFAELAQKYSDGNSKYAGGDLGYFVLGIQDDTQQNLDMLRDEIATDGFDAVTYKFGLKVDKEIENAVKYMKKDEVSQVIRSQFGYHIIKFVEKRDGDIKPYEDVVDEITENMDVVIPESEIRAYYEENKERYRIPASAKVRHILVKTEEEAQKVKAEISAGGDFAEIAKKYSQDYTKDAGGEIGWVEKGKMTENFDNAAFTLPVGNVSDPVKTEFGYHIIQVLDRKDERIASYAEKKKEIEEQLLAPKKDKLYTDWITELRNKAKIEIFKENFKYFDRMDF